MKFSKLSIFSLLILLAYTVIYVILTHQWLRSNLTPPSWDQSAFLRASEDFYHAIIAKDVHNFLYIFNNSFGGTNPPLISLLPVPIYFLFGDGLSSQIYVFIVPIILFFLFYFLLIKELTDSPYIAIAAIILTSTMPFVAYMSRTYLIEYWEMVLSVIWLYILHHSSRLKVHRYNILLGIILGFGLLLKVSFPIYIMGPFILILIFRIYESKEKSIAESDILYLNLLTIFFPAFLIAITWYKINFSRIISYSLSAGFGALAKDYSMGNPLDLTVLIAFWKMLITDVISSYLFFLLIVTLLIFTFEIVFRNKATVLLQAKQKNVFLLLTWFMIPFLLASLSLNKNPKYILPALPAYGALIALLLVCVFGIKKNGLLFISLLLVIPITTYNYITIPQMGTGPLKFGYFTLLNEEIVEAYRPKGDYWPIDQIVERIAQDAKEHWSGSNLMNSKVMMVVDHQQLNQNTFSYIASIKRTPIIFNTLLTRNEYDWIFQKGNVLTSDYIIVKTGYQGPDFTNAANASIKNLLDSGELPFKELFTCPLPDGSIAVVYRLDKYEFPLPSSDP